VVLAFGVLDETAVCLGDFYLRIFKIEKVAASCIAIPEEAGNPWLVTTLILI